MVLQRRSARSRERRAVHREARGAVGSCSARPANGAPTPLTGGSNHTGKIDYEFFSDPRDASDLKTVEPRFCLAWATVTAATATLSCGTRLLHEGIARRPSTALRPSDEIRSSGVKTHGFELPTLEWDQP